MSSPSKTIKETREVIRALGAAAARTIKNLEDGKFSYLEMAGYFADIGIDKAALEGISGVPAELADLDNDEKAALLEDITAELVAAGLSHRVADSAEKVLNWAYLTVRTFLDVKNAPPSATPA